MGSFWDHSGLIPRSFWDDFGITLGSFCGLRRVGNIAPRGLPPRSGPTGPTPSGEWRHPAPPGRIDLRVPSQGISGRSHPYVTGCGLYQSFRDHSGVIPGFAVDSAPVRRWLGQATRSGPRGGGSDPHQARWVKKTNPW